MPSKPPIEDVDAYKKQLIAFGKKKGAITQEQLINMLPPTEVGADRLGQWTKVLQDAGVSVLTGSAEKSSTRKTSRSKKKKKDDDDTTRTNDPVRMYLRKMGSVSLLTREGEVEIAKRIEQGELRVIDIVLHSPVAVPYIYEMYERIKRSQLRIKDVIAIATPNDQGTPNEKETAPINQEAAFENLQRQVERIRRHQKDIEKLGIQLLGEAGKKLPDAKKAQIFKQIDDHLVRLRQQR